MNILDEQDRHPGSGNIPPTPHSRAVFAVRLDVIFDFRHRDLHEVIEFRRVDKADVEGERGDLEFHAVALAFVDGAAV